MSCFAAAPSCQFLCAGDIALRVIANFLNVAVADPADVINLMEALSVPRLGQCRPTCALWYPRGILH
jgi:hypothetical protein